MSDNETSEEGTVAQFSNRPASIHPGGHGVTVTTWRNKNDKGEWSNVGIEYSYKVGDEWKSAKISLNPDAALAMSLVLQDAYRETVLQQQQSRSQGRGRAAA